MRCKRSWNALMRTPRFSIVVPTRNRADMLRGAVGSALRQSWGDFEVVVVDNSTDGESERVVACFGDERLRYVRTPGDLLMHENWQLALEQGRGEFITFLCDDDALHPRALEAVGAWIDISCAEAVCWRSCSFCWPSWPDVGLQGRVRFGPPYSDRAWRIDGRRAVLSGY